MLNPYSVTRDFELALCEYTGSRFACAVNSCTAALLLCCEWYFNYEPSQGIPSIPKKTYCSVPMAIMRAGFPGVLFRDEKWRGAYQLEPYPIWDCARRFTSGMYVPSQFQCISFSSSKILGIEQGGAILHDNENADRWFRRMRFDGRTEGVDQREERFTELGHHCIMLPSIAAQALLKLYHLPKHNKDLLEYDYPDLSKHEVFK